jgi:hypothetical protein
MGCVKMLVTFLLETLKERDHLRDIIVDGRIILEWILGK